jgi:prephenate dehydrogenase
VSEVHFTDPPHSIGIVGVGLMGGSLGLALRRLPDPPHIVGVGRDPGRLARAVALGAVDETSTDLNALISLDTVVLCTTIGHIVDTLPLVMERVGPGTTVTDVGSTKSTIVRQAGGRPNFVGGHPMAGSEQAGVESARADLYRDATWAVTPVETTDTAHLRRTQAIARAVGAKVLLLDPDVHDAIVAITSHVPHVLASALVQEAGRMRAEHSETSAMTAGSFADATRIAASPPEIWRDVCLTNRDAVLKALASFSSRILILQEAVEAGDAESIETFFNAGRDAKASWPPHVRKRS